ncbi:hypothetical protein [Gordonia sp. X0973]|uniref:DUF7572 family protein n=1 Tax=Gordonia sp. X0973 TaxID=2742602 RepID=UPI0026575BA1|nr:hypothetical protein [Gordonia sp. X0973]
MLITVPDYLPPLGAIDIGGVRVAADAPTPTDVFLADEYGQPIDADGDPTNGLTALLRLAGGTGFDVACQKAEELLG